MRFTNLPFITLLFVLCGCNQQPTNPAGEVLANPPEEIDTSAFLETSILLNGKPALAETVSLTSGEKLQVETKLIRRNQEIRPMMNMLHIRVLPEGSVGKRWANYPFVDEFLCVPGPVNGTGSVETTVNAAPGEYEYRCFMMYHYATEEKPEFYLLSKGKLVVAPAAPSK